MFYVMPPRLVGNASKLTFNLSLFNQPHRLTNLLWYIVKPGRNLLGCVTVIVMEVVTLARKAVACNNKSYFGNVQHILIYEIVVLHFHQPDSGTGCFSLELLTVVIIYLRIPNISGNFVNLREHSLRFFFIYSVRLDTLYEDILKLLVSYNGVLL